MADNPYLRLVEQQDREDRSRLEISMDAGRQVPAERTAQAIEISRETGVPVDVAQRTEVPRKNPYLDVINGQPKLREWLSDPVNASLAQGEEEQLSWLDRQMDYIPRSYERGQNMISLKDYRLPELYAQLGVGSPLTEEQQREADRLSQSIKEGGVDIRLDNIYEWAFPQIAEQVPIMGNLMVQTGKWALGGAAAGGTAGNLMPGVGTVTGAAAGATAGSRVGLFKGAFELEAALAWDELRSIPGVDPQDAAYASIAVGGVNGLLESAFGPEAMISPAAVAVRRLFQRKAVKSAINSPTVRGILTRIGKVIAGNFLAEGATETLQEFTPAFAKSFLTLNADEKNPITYDKFVEHLFTDENTAEWLKAGLAGGVTGAAFGGVMSAPSTANDIIDYRRAKTIERSLLEMGDRLAQTRSAPEYVGSASQDNVYVDVADWDTYWQSQGVEPEQAAVEVLGDVQQYKQAAEGQHQLSIPMGKYARTLGKSEHNKYFASVIRVEPDQMNAREAEQYIKEKGEQDIAQVQAKEEKRAALEKRTAERLMDLGHGRETAETNAKIFARIWTQQAEVEGRDVEEIIAERGLDISQYALAPDGSIVNQIGPTREPTGDFVGDAAPKPPDMSAFSDDALFSLGYTTLDRMGTSVEQVAYDATVAIERLRKMEEQSAGRPEDVADARRRINEIIAGLDQITQQGEDTRFATGKPVTVRGFHGSSSARIAEEGFRSDVLGSNTGAPSARMGHFFAGRPETSNSYTGPNIESLDVEDLALNRKKELWAFIYDEVKSSNPDYSVQKIVAQARKIMDTPHKAYAAYVRAFGEPPFEPTSPVVYPARLHFKNPYVHDYKGQSYREESYASVIAKAKAAGHDGVILLNTYDGGPLDNIFVVFDDEQIEQTLYQSAKPAVDRLQMVAERGERATGQRALISKEERAAIEESADRVGISVREITAAVRAHKLAHPQAAGWAPLVYLRTKVEDGKVTHEYQKTSYSFSSDADGRQLGEGTPERKRRVNALAKSMTEEVRRVFARAQAGDKNAQNILAQAGWYKSMRTRLRQEFGGLGDLFADLLGATSPNTPVRDNWSNAVDSLRRAMRGDFDKLIVQWEAWADNIDALESDLKAYFNAGLTIGLSKKDIKAQPEYQAKLDALKEARKLPASMLPTKESGKNYGFNGRNVARAMVGLWRVVRNADADIARGGTAPKAVNFSGNLIGFRERATIDVWAARMLQRLAGGRRIPSMAETGVSGEMREDGSTTLQFGFGQDVFSEAVKRIRSDAELKTDKTLAEINDDDLQAVVWFIEKELWTVNNWTSVAGEGGSFELEADLTGSAKQARIKELRRILDSSRSKPEQKAEARAELATLERTVDRFVGGLSTQMSADTQGVDYVPTDTDMVRLSESIRAAIYEADDGATVLGSKALATEGRYGGVERSLDLEVVAREGFDASPLWLRMLKEAQAAKQDSVFLSRVLRPDEDVDPLVHRPGVEIYFRDAAAADRLEAVLAELATQGVEFFTVVVDGRRSPSAVAGEMPPAVGVRLQYVPEFEQRYGMDSFDGLDDSAVGDRIAERASALRALAERVSAEIEGVSFAGQFWYETQVAFSSQYQEKIDALATGTPEGSTEGVGGKKWVGQSVRQGLEDANRQARETASGEPGGDVLGGDEVRADAEQFLTDQGAPAPDLLLQSGTARPTILNQRNENAPRGFMQIRRQEGAPSRLNIGLLENADLSTFMHETAHAYLEVMRDFVGELQARLARGEKITDRQQQYLDDSDALLKWMKLDDWSQLDVDRHEQFARGFESYLMEGKAPSPELRTAFHRFKIWLTQIYKQITSLNVNLSDEVRGVMDRMLASQEEIEAARQELQIRPIFLDATSAGMSEAQFKNYRKTIEVANAEAHQRLEQAMYDEWVREQKKWWKEETARMENEVEAELLKTRPFRTIVAIATGKLPDGREVPAVKLSRRAIEATYGDEAPEILAALKKHNVVRIEDSISPDEAAQLYGYGSGDEMVRELARTPGLRAEVRRLAGDRMRAEHGDMMRDAGLRAQEARMAVLNERQEQVLEAELKALHALQRAAAPMLKTAAAEQRQAQRQGIATLRAVPGVEVFKQIAEGRISQMRVRDLQPNTYLVAMRKAAKASEEALARQDYVTASAHKQAEALNLQMYLLATKAKAAADKQVAFLRSFSKKSIRERLGKTDYLTPIDAILSRVDLLNVPLRQLDWVAEMQAFLEKKAEEKVPIFLPPELARLTLKKNYKEMTVDELTGINDAVKHLDHMSRHQDRLLKAIDKLQFDELKAKLIESAQERGKGELLEFDDSPQDVVAKTAGNLVALHRKPSFFIRLLDGFKDNGFWHRNVLRPMNEAANRETSMKTEASEKMKAAFDRYTSIGQAIKMKASKATLGMVKDEFFRKTFIPELKTQIYSGNASKANLLMIALNLGNEGNKQRLLDGYGWDEAQVMKALDKHLTRDDWAFVEEIWSLVNGYWPEIAAMHKRVYGVEPGKVEGIPVRTKYGIINGAYFPIKYDSKKGTSQFFKNTEEAANALMSGEAFMAQTKNGHRQARVSAVKGQPISLDIDVIAIHLNNVIHDLTHFEAVNDVNRILRDGDIKREIIANHGEQTLDQLNSWLQDSAAGDRVYMNTLERGLLWMRTGVSVASLGLNLTTAALQVTGYAQSIVRLRPAWAWAGLKSFYSNPFKMSEEILGKSEFMRNRSRTLTQEINEALNTIKGGTKMTAAMFALISKMQSTVDFPTWQGAYLKALDSGMKEADAVSTADQAVRDTQMGGQTGDIAGIMRGNGMAKLFTVFMSYMNTTFNLASESYNKTDFTKPREVGLFIGDMLLLYTVPSVLGMMIREALLPGDDDDDDKTLAEKILREQASMMLGQFVGLRELSGVVQGYGMYQGPAGTRIFGDSVALAVQIGQGEVDQSFLRSANRVGGIVFHYPALQVDRTVRGAVALAEGETDNPLALVAGPPRN